MGSLRYSGFRIQTGHTTVSRQIYMNFATDKYFYRALRFACKIDEVKFFLRKITQRRMKSSSIEFHIRLIFLTEQFIACEIDEVNFTKR